MRTVIGLDPDSDKHGAAVFEGGNLVQLEMVTTIHLVSKIIESGFKPQSFLISIEDVMSNQFVYARNRKGSAANQSKIAMHIGRCQQAQVELMRWLDHYSIPYALHKPTKSNWANDRARFERATGWKKQSNSDTRSAAFFGMLEV